MRYFGTYLRPQLLGLNLLDLPQRCLALLINLLGLCLLLGFFYLRSLLLFFLPLTLFLFDQLHFRLILFTSPRVGHHESLCGLSPPLSFLISCSSVQNGLFVQNPVVLTIILELKFAEEGLKEVAEVLVVRLLLEGQIACVVHVLLKRQRTALAKLLNGCISLRVEDRHGPLGLRLLL